MNCIMNKHGLFSILVILSASIDNICQVECAQSPHHFDLLDFWERDDTKFKEGKQTNYRRQNKRTMAPAVSMALNEVRSAVESFFHDFDSYKDNPRLRPQVKKLQKINARLGEGEISSDSVEIKASRRSMGKHGHSHGPHHRWKNRNKKHSTKPDVIQWVHEAPVEKGQKTEKDMENERESSQREMRVHSESEDTESSNETRKYPKMRVAYGKLKRPMRLAQETPPPTVIPTKQVDPLDPEAKIEETESTTHSSEPTTSYVPITSYSKLNLSPYSLEKSLTRYILPHFDHINITLETLGRTVEYNSLILLKATQPVNKMLRSENVKYDDIISEKKVIFIVHGLSVMGFNDLPCMRSLNSVKILYSYYFSHLDKFDIYLMPMANPDGVSASSAKPYWNKNMSPQEACSGVALDRNFDIAWNDSLPLIISSCSQHYPGSTPFSEPESQAVRDVLHKYSHKIVGYIHVHASTYSASIFKGDAVLYPKGFTDSQSDDDKYIDLRGEIEEAMRNASFKVLSVTTDTLFNWYGKVLGTSVDYACSVYGVTFCLEFAMQLYEDDMMVDVTMERETGSALVQVWQRVIDTVFDFVYKTVAKVGE